MQTSYKFNRNQLIALCSVTLLVPALRLVPSLTASLGGMALRFRGGAAAAGICVVPQPLHVAP